MTKSEQQIQELIRLNQESAQNNRAFQQQVNESISKINEKVEKKHLPIQLESDILQVAQQSIADALKSVLTGYSSPLIKLITEVINENSGELKGLISDSFKRVIRTEEFKSSIVSAFSHKVAKTIISNNDGLFDKVSNELKQDSTFKAKMTIAVSNVVEECLHKSN